MTTLANGMGTHTLVGYGRSLFPRDDGNCFSVGETPLPRDAHKCCEWVEEVAMRVVNVHYENFAELQRRGLISFPIEIEVINDRSNRSNRLCAITDKRVPEDWKLTEPCSSCVRDENMAAAQQYCRGED